MDEVCGDTVFSSRGFYSSLNYEEPHVHTVYSLGKALAMTGMPTGIFYSNNREVVRAIAAQAYFARMPNSLQVQIAWLLEHPGFSALLERSQSLLSVTADRLSTRLKSMGIEVINPEAGVFIWFNLAGVLKINSFEEELRVFQELMSGARINISPGQLFCCAHPGWFRLCYSVPADALEEALRRLSEFLNKARHKICSADS